MQIKIMKNQNSYQVIQQDKISLEVGYFNVVSEFNQEPGNNVNILTSRTTNTHNYYVLLKT